MKVKLVQGSYGRCRQLLPRRPGRPTRPARCPVPRGAGDDRHRQHGAGGQVHQGLADLAVPASGLSAYDAGRAVVDAVHVQSGAVLQQEGLRRGGLDPDVPPQSSTTFVQFSQQIVDKADQLRRRARVGLRLGRRLVRRAVVREGAGVHRRRRQRPHQSRHQGALQQRHRRRRAHVPAGAAQRQRPSTSATTPRPGSTTCSSWPTTRSRQR